MVCNQTKQDTFQNELLDWPPLKLTGYIYTWLKCFDLAQAFFSWLNSCIVREASSRYVCVYVGVLFVACMHLSVHLPVYLSSQCLSVYFMSVFLALRVFGRHLLCSPSPQTWHWPHIWDVLSPSGRTAIQMGLENARHEVWWPQRSPSSFQGVKLENVTLKQTVDQYIPMPLIWMDEYKGFLKFQISLLSLTPAIFSSLPFIF